MKRKAVIHQKGRSLPSIVLALSFLLIILSLSATPILYAQTTSHDTQQVTEHQNLAHSKENDSSEHEGSQVLHRVMLIVFQIAIIIIAAKLGAEFTERVLKQPGVLGELVVGILISPYLFGHLIYIPFVGQIFPSPESVPWMGFEAHNNLPVPMAVYVIAQIAAVILLFMAGLETDLKSFIKYGFASTVVGIGGVVFSQLFGMWLAVVGGFAKNYLDPAALFLGAMMVATSVGITARVLSEIHKLDTPEGVTILGGAVVDDVLGILTLAIVLGIVKAEKAGTQLDIGGIGSTALKAIGVWIGLMAFFLIFKDIIAKGLKFFKSPGAAHGLAIAICFFASAVAESFGLAMIIGAYVVGLAFSATELKHFLEEHLYGIYHAFVPVFFVVLGMMVNVHKMVATWKFGLIVSVIAILTKLLGCGLPALSVGFNWRGGMRIGMGMVPRGEVALIVAGVGLTAGAIGQDLFGLSIMMTVITTLIAPIALVPLFQKGGSGLKAKKLSSEEA